MHGPVRCTSGVLLKYSLLSVCAVRDSAGKQATTSGRVDRESDAKGATGSSEDRGGAVTSGIVVVVVPCLVLSSWCFKCCRRKAHETSDELVTQKAQR